MRLNSKVIYKEKTFEVLEFLGYGYCIITDGDFPLKVKIADLE